MVGSKCVWSMGKSLMANVLIARLVLLLSYPVSLIAKCSTTFASASEADLILQRIDDFCLICISIQWLHMYGTRLRSAFTH